MAPPSAIDVEVSGVTDVEGITIPNPLTVDGVAFRRAKTQKMSSGVAAFTSSDMFKSPLVVGLGGYQ